MKSAEILADTDRTSWSRICMVARYYWPRYKWPMLLYPAAALIIVAVALSLAAITDRPKVAIMIIGLANYLVIFNPLILTRRRDAEITATLPALGLEKCVVLLVMTFVVMPLMLVPIEAAYHIVNGELYLPSAMLSELHLDSPLYVASNVLSTLCMTATCLWAVTASRTHRTLKGIAFPFALSIAVGFAAAICGFVTAITSAGTPTPDDMARQVLDTVYTIGIPVMAVYLLVALTMTCRTITRRQM